MTNPFEDFDFAEFWEDSEYARTEYTDRAPTDTMLALVEDRLGYKLPAAYIALARWQNGGIPKRTCHRTREYTSWAHDHIAITGIYSIGNLRNCSLLGTYSSAFWASEWGYPAIGIYFADCPSAGHDMVCLDYSICGPRGEPRVVHVDQEYDYAITEVADTFVSFIRGLEFSENFDDDEGS